MKLAATGDLAGRAIPEWIGATADTAIPPRVRLRVFARYSGICQRSGAKIAPTDEWDCDHRVALANGGEHREGNLVPVLRVEHVRKTAADRAEKARIDRKRKKHIGIRPRSRFATSRTGPYKQKVGGTIVRRET